MVFLSLLLIILGFVGILLPIVPGVPLVYGGVLLYGLTQHPPELTTTVLIVFGLLTLLSFGIDAIGQFLGAKKGQASPAGIRGGVIGLVIGILFSPLGGISLLVLPPLGVILGELAAGRGQDASLRAGTWTFLGNILAIILNLIIAGVMAAWFIRALI